LLLVSFGFESEARCEERKFQRPRMLPRTWGGQTNMCLFSARVASEFEFPPFRCRTATLVRLHILRSATCDVGRNLHCRTWSWECMRRVARQEERVQMLYSRTLGEEASFGRRCPHFDAARQWSRPGTFCVGCLVVRLAAEGGAAVFLIVMSPLAGQPVGVSPRVASSLRLAS